MIYFLQRADGAIKIGTSGHYSSRIYQLRALHGHLDLLGWMDGGREQEALLHKQFKAYRIAPILEWFRDCAELRQYIADNCKKEPPQTVAVKKPIDYGDDLAGYVNRLHVALEGIGVNTHDPKRKQTYSDSALFRWLVEQKLTELEAEKDGQP